MPALKNQKWEMFAQALVEGKSANQAYVSAGYKYNEGNSIRLKGNEKVSARVQELQVSHVQRHNVTIDSLTDKLETARLSAMDGSREAAAISAVMGMAKIHGIGAEKYEHSGPDGGAIELDVTDLELARRVGFILSKGSDVSADT